MGSSYNDWLKSSYSELKTINIIENLIKENNFARAKMLLNNLDLTTLIKYTELSKTITDFCEEAEQADIWRTHLQNFNEEHFSFEEYPPLTVSQLVKGIYFYGQAAECREEEGKPFGDNELEFLKKSAHQHCFYAYNSLSTWAYEKYKMGLNDYSLLTLHYTQKASQYHWTPGYLLFYKTCLNLAILSNAPSLSYQEALEALLIAQKLSEHQYSISAINNAYFGKGLIHGNKTQMESWDKAISETIAKGKIPSTLLNKIYDKASEKAKGILDEFTVEVKDMPEEEKLENESAPNLSF
ncbi:TPA: lpg1670 family Dot/Icm T4SS effector [Legionella pneumophila]